MYNFSKIDESKIGSELMKQIKKEALMIHKPNFEWYCLYSGDTLLCIIAIGFRKNHYMIEAVYTPKSLRGYGFATTTLRRVCEIYNKEYDILADCLDSSVSMFKKVGFENTKSIEYKICNIHKCILKKGAIYGK